jgi:mevalonate kinase
MIQRLRERRRERRQDRERIATYADAIALRRRIIRAIETNDDNATLRELVDACDRLDKALGIMAPDYDRAPLFADSDLTLKGTR